MSSFRSQRVAELLKRELGEILRREFPSGEKGVLTVNDVSLSSDLKAATVFVGFVGTPAARAEIFAALHRERKKLQGMIGRAVTLKYTPHLRFIHDEAVNRGNRILEILNEIEQSHPSKPEEPAEEC